MMNLCCVNTAEEVRNDYTEYVEKLESAMQKLCDRMDEMDPKGSSILFASIADIYKEHKELLKEGE